MKQFCTKDSNIVPLALMNSPVAHIVTRSRVITYANNKALELFGYVHDELSGKLILKLYPSYADFKKIGDRCYNGMLNNPAYADERFMQKSDGTIFWVLARGVSLTPETPFDFAIWTFEEITSRSSIEEVLSPREREVSSYIVNGMTCKGIAQKLGISHRTVEAHRAKIMKKLSCRNTAELISRIVLLP